MIQAPWTAKQVSSLRKYQEMPGVHPYTCENGHQMTAGVGGWSCGKCGTYQRWAHVASVELGQMSTKEAKKNGRQDMRREDG